ncbi:inorganic anion transporter, SulP family, partial [Ostertagia ostertagi]
MAYSVLATLPPVFGLYASFFPPLFYFLFGTSNHISIGVFSLTCIMTGQARLSILSGDVNGTTATDYEGIHDLTPIDVVVLLAFLTGIIQLMMWVLHLSFLSTYLTDSAVTGLTVGAAIHAMTAQVKGLLGITLRHTSSGFLQLFGKWYAIVEGLPNTNLVTLAISVSTITFLVLYKKIVEPVLKKKNISLPAELLALVVITFISAMAHFHDRFGVIIVGDIPTGLPPPKAPRFEEILVERLIIPAASIAVVAYAVTVSMGKLFARKHKYHINPNQEILALGIASTISSFFSVLPTSTSLSRSLVNEGAGARTQLSGMVASAVILCVILVIAPLLSALPMCVLNSIVVVALSSLLSKITELKYLWRFSKSD